MLVFKFLNYYLVILFNCYHINLIRLIEYNLIIATKIQKQTRVQIVTVTPKYQIINDNEMITLADPLNITFQLVF